MSNERYFSRSWELLTRDKGWIKPLLVMTAANFVPIAGALGNKGYALEWGRLTAWGVDAAPKQKNVDVGACIHSGWRAFVVDLGWIACLVLATSLIMAIVGLIPGVFGALLGILVSLAITVASAFFGSILQVAELRTSIYERISAGYRVNRVLEMIKRDVSGFCKVFLIGLVCALVIGAVATMASMVITAELMPVFFSMAAYDEMAMLTAFASCLGWLVVTAAIFGCIVTFVTVGVRLILVTATALWMRQFDVPNWGRSEDPLPGASAAAAGSYGSAVPDFTPEKRYPVDPTDVSQVEETPATEESAAEVPALPAEPVVEDDESAMSVSSSEEVVEDEPTLVAMPTPMDLSNASAAELQEQESSDTWESEVATAAEDEPTPSETDDADMTDTMTLTRLVPSEEQATEVLVKKDALDDLLNNAPIPEEPVKSVEELQAELQDLLNKDE